jgi:threonine dehydrogenase-like Zn-dependent dehydrogenase
MPEMGDYDCLCELLYGATCSGTDTHIINDTFLMKIEHPTILGHESIGRVIKLGPKVRNFKLGDVITRVGTPAVDGVGVTWGGFAEYGIARDHVAMQEDGYPRSEWGGYRWNKVVPPDIGPDAATMMTTWRETMSYLKRMGFASGDTILIVGSGGNGLCNAAHAVNLGGSRVAMIGSPERKDVALKLGATHYYSYKCETLAADVKAAAPDGYKFIIDATGKNGALDGAMQFLARDGFATIYGVDDYGKCSINPSNARGSFTYLNRGYEEAETHDEVIEFIRQGKLDAGDWLNLDSPYPLERISDAFEAVWQRKVVKALVKLRG